MSEVVSSAEQLYRRKFPRRKFRRQIGLLLAGHYQLVVGSEIGEGGIAFIHSEQLEVGRLLIVNFQLPLGELISVRAEVRNRKPFPGKKFFYGCSFINLKFEAKREIRTFVTARSAEET